MRMRRIVSMRQVLVLILVAAVLPLALPTPALADVTCTTTLGRDHDRRRPGRAGKQ